MLKEIHCSNMVCNIWKFTALKCPPVGEMDEQIVVYTHNGVQPIVKLNKLDLYLRILKKQY